MTMHLVRGMTTTRTRKQKPRKKTAAILHEEMLMAKLLKKVGYKPGQKATYDIPNYKEHRRETAPTSDKVVPIINGRKNMVYTGDEIIGIGTLHKSNMVPIRKDSNAAVEIATMRRS